MPNQFTGTVPLIVAGFFPVTNPPPAGFIVLSLVPTATSSERACLAKVTSLDSLIIQVTSLSVGAYVLSLHYCCSASASRFCGSAWSDSLLT
jgi:multiple antibiotic resistance protein